MADTKLILGDFTFDSYEIPESIPFGGAQRLVTHQFPGGARAVQAMGRDDAPVAWTGLFFGLNALYRARYIDNLRVTGAALTLSYLDFNYLVVIDKFEANLKKMNRIPYSISLTVVQDNTQPITGIADTGFDAAIRGDNAAAQGLGASIGDGPLSGLLGTMDSAISGVSDFAKATSASLAAVVGPVGAVLTRTKTLLGNTSSVVNSVTTLGGILPGNPIAVQAQRALSQVTAATQYPMLVSLLNVANRIQGNLGSVAGTQQVRTVTVAGGSLFDLAQKYYGDAKRWTTIAQANNLSDPQLTGVQSLKIPLTAAASGGVPTQ